MNTNKKWWESKKFLCWLMTTIMLFVLSGFMAWKELGWQAVAVAGMFAIISAVLIIGQAAVDRILYRGVQAVAALKGDELDEG